MLGAARTLGGGEERKLGDDEMLGDDDRNDGVAATLGEERKVEGGCEMPCDGERYAGACGPMLGCDGCDGCTRYAGACAVLGLEAGGS